MCKKKIANKILQRYEDKHEYHFHELDRKWIVKAMIEFADKVNSKTKKVKIDPDKIIKVSPIMVREDFKNPPPPPEDRIIKEGKTPKPPKKK